MASPATKQGERERESDVTYLAVVIAPKNWEAMAPKTQRKN